MTDDQADIGLSELRDEYVYDGASLLVISGCRLDLGVVPKV
jgi:hypothetical protein